MQALLPQSSSQVFQRSLLAIATCLMAIHLGLMGQRLGQPGNINLLGTAVLSWGTLMLLLHRERRSLQWARTRWQRVAGVLLLGLWLVASWRFGGELVFLRLAAWIGGVGILLLGLKPGSWRQGVGAIAILSVLAIPESINELAIGLPHLTAQVATALLTPFGFTVSQQGQLIVFPTGALNVNLSCSGAIQMLQVFKISVLYLVLFPTRLTQTVWMRGLVPLAAILIAFGVNSGRIALLAALVAWKNLPAFEYWHTGKGAHIFSLSAVLLFGAFAYALMELSLATPAAKSPASASATEK